MEQTFFTVFTSVYNRKHTIHRVWESLKEQTYKNFEWILIDNGSSDNILPLLEEYKSKADFPVKIYVQENMGKYRAFDRVLDIAKGELVIPADSDDWFEHNTIERFNDVWNEYKAEDVAGITVLCKYEDGSIVGESFPIEGISNYTEIVFKHKVDAEAWGCVRLDLLQKYRYPRNFDVKYFPDQYVWAQIGFNYNTVFINEPLRTYYQDSGNQITHTKYVSKEFMRMKNFFTTWKINYIFPRVENYISYKEYFQTFVFLWLTAFRAGVNVTEVFKKIERTKSKIVAFIFLFPSFIIYKFNFKLKFLRKKKYKYQTLQTLEMEKPKKN